MARTQEDDITEHTFVRLSDLIERRMVDDLSKLKIIDGRIHFFLYQQDGTKQPMDIEDTHRNRMAVSWFQIHDRYATSRL